VPLTRTARTASAARDPAVVLAADESFALPLAVTVRSALESLSPGRKLNLYVLDGGLSNATKQRLVRSWPEGRYHVSWLRVDASVLAHVPTSGHVNLVSYFRILMPWLLPVELERVIYLDADLIVRADLAQLWDCQLTDRLCLAAQDCAAPYIDASAALVNYDRCGPHLGSPRPVANFRQLGLDPLAPYFNAGVLLVDLAGWRAADLPTQMLACLKQNHEHVLWWDQYALNVVLAGRWGALDTRWNQGSNIYAYPGWSHSPFDRQTFERLRDEPHIVHFTTRYKPWKVSCLHPLRRLFFQYVDRTDWAGWRPSRFNHPRAFFELLKTQERRLRHARRRLRIRFADWLHPNHEPAQL
jgi:lipopolysaccharide biosynthesis glycosyltransferase